MSMLLQKKNASKNNSNASGVANHAAHGPGSRASDHPPAVPLVKTQYSGVSPNIRKDRRQNSSNFNISQNRELQALPLFAGKLPTIYNITVEFWLFYYNYTILYYLIIIILYKYWSYRPLLSN